MTVAEATPDFEQGDRHDRAFLGHPTGLGFLGFTEACERFSYYSMQTLLTSTWSITSCSRDTSRRSPVSPG
jgi:POT family proton-dependent oligopeptide transporter